VTVLATATAAKDVTGPDGETIPHDQVHRFLAEIKLTADITR
jgi:hypothetical protein